MISFTPKEFTLGRQMMEDAMFSGEGEFDLLKRIFSKLSLTKRTNSRKNE